MAIIKKGFNPFKSTAVKKEDKGTLVSTTNVKVRNNPFSKRSVVKVKREVDRYVPTASKGLIYEGSQKSIVKKTFKNGVLKRTKVR